MLTAQQMLFPSFPDGLDVEVLKKTTFERVVKNACTPSQLEHVTPFIYENKHMFKYPAASAVNLSAYRWTVDGHVDLDWLDKFMKNSILANPNFSMSDILDFIKEHSFELPQNGHIRKNEVIKVYAAMINHKFFAELVCSYV